MFYDTFSADFYLTFNYTSSCTSNRTEVCVCVCVCVIYLILYQIYLNEDIHYKNGYTVKVSPSSVTYVSAKNSVIVTHPLQMKEGTEISVEIHRR